MTTTATVAEAKQQIVSLLTTALATAGATGEQLPVLYAWNPSVTSDCVFLGRPLLGGSDVVSATTAVTLASPVAEATTMSTATYTINGTCWSFRPDLLPDQAQDAEDRVNGFWTLARRALAPLSWIASMSVEFELRPFEAGWAALALFTVEVHARLT